MTPTVFRLFWGDSAPTSLSTSGTLLGYAVKLVGQCLVIVAPDGTFRRSHPILCTISSAVMLASGGSMLEKLGVPVVNFAEYMLRTIPFEKLFCIASGLGGVGTLHHSLGYSWTHSLLSSWMYFGVSNILFWFSINSLEWIARERKSKLGQHLLHSNSAFASAVLWSIARRLQAVDHGGKALAGATPLCLMGLSLYAAVSAAKGFESVENFRFFRPVIEEASRLGWKATIETCKAIWRVICFVRDRVLLPLARAVIKVWKFVLDGVLMPLARGCVRVGKAMRGAWKVVWDNALAPVVRVLRSAIVKMFKFVRDRIVMPTARAVRTASEWIGKHVLRPLLNLVDKYIATLGWPVIVTAVAAKFFANAISAGDDLVSKMGFVAGGVAATTAVLCLLGRSLSLSRYALVYKLGEFLRKCGTWGILFQDFGLLNALDFLLCVAIDGLSAVFRQIWNLLNTGIQFVKQTLLSALRFISRIFLRIWADPVLSFLSAGSMVGLGYYLWSRKIDVIPPYLSLENFYPLIRNAIVVAGKAWTLLKAATVNTYSKAKGFYSLQAMQCLDSPNFALTMYILTTSIPKLSVRFSGIDTLYRLVPIAVAGVTKALFVPVVTLGAISRFGGKFAVYTASLFAVPLSMIFVVVSGGSLFYEVRERSRLQSVVAWRGSLQRDQNRGSVREKIKVKDLRKPVRLFWSDDCLVCLEPFHSGSSGSPQDSKPQEQKTTQPLAAAVAVSSPGKLPPELGALPCGHVFHEECVEKWLNNRASKMRCPTCREPVQGGGAATYMF